MARETVMRMCPRCGEVKPHGKNAANKQTGLQGYCVECNPVIQREYRDRNSGHVRQMYADYRARDRRIVIEHYGGHCACCGEDQFEFLCIDHVDGVPDEHRRPDGKRLAGSKVYARLIKAGFPVGYRVLCWNCNSARAHDPEGICPHERRLRLVTSG